MSLNWSRQLFPSPHVVPLDHPLSTYTHKTHPQHAYHVIPDKEIVWLLVCDVSDRGSEDLFLEERKCPLLFPGLAHRHIEACTKTHTHTERHTRTHKDKWEKPVKVHTSLPQTPTLCTLVSLMKCVSFNLKLRNRLLQVNFFQRGDMQPKKQSYALLYNRGVKTEHSRKSTAHTQQPNVKWLIFQLHHIHDCTHRLV